MDLELIKTITTKIIKYLVEGLAVAVAAYYIPRRKMALPEIAAIGVSAAAIFAVLDILGPKLADPVKTGMGLGIGILAIAR
jgi:hypothetical protein